METSQGIIYFLLICAVYFAPTWIARKGRRGSVFVVNLAFGWTVLGWFIALYLAVRSKESAEVAR